MSPENVRQLVQHAVAVVSQRRDGEARRGRAVLTSSAACSTRSTSSACDERSATCSTRRRCARPTGALRRDAREGDHRRVGRVRGARAARSAGQRRARAGRRRVDFNLLFHRAVLHTQLAISQDDRPQLVAATKDYERILARTDRRRRDRAVEPRRDLHDARRTSTKRSIRIARRCARIATPRRCTASPSRSIATNVAIKRSDVIVRAGRASDGRVPAQRVESRTTFFVPDGRGVLLLRAGVRSVRQ